jgi:hypothetical protein
VRLLGDRLLHQRGWGTTAAAASAVIAYRWALGDRIVEPGMSSSLAGTHNGEHENSSQDKFFHDLSVLKRTPFSLVLHEMF